MVAFGRTPKSDETIHASQSLCSIDRSCVCTPYFVGDVVLRPVVPATGLVSVNDADANDAV